MRTGAAVLLLLVSSAACTTLTLAPTPSSSAEACSAALLEGELLADDQDGFIVRHEEGFVTAVIWPDGYSVRDGDDGTGELLDPSGHVAAREGDHVALGGGMNAADTAFIVCGPFTVTQAQ